MSSLISELKRRNVFRIALAYIITAWLLLQVADVVLNNIEAPQWVFKATLLLVAIGFPFALILAWAFELTPEGLKKEKDVDRSASVTPATGRQLDRVIIGAMALALLYFSYDKFLAEPQAEPDATVNSSVAADAPTQPAIEGPIERSIAVLPFVNMSSDPEQEYFSDGISEELLNVLAQLPQLRVAARTSSFQFKGMNQDIADIAATLKVAHILEGSVRKSGTKLRITAQLIKADDGYHLWSETYDREIDDIFAVQDEIAAAIGDALKVQLSLDGKTGTAAAEVIKAANTDAYDAYLRGRQLIHRRGREPLEEAVRNLELSLRLDNNFAPAHAQLAIATALLMESPESYGTLSQEEVLRVAVPHLDRAQELEPNLAEAYAGRALLALDTRDQTYAIAQADKALAINPSYTDALNWKYLALASIGRYDEQIETMMKILEVDPMTVIGRMNYASYLGGMGQVQEGHRVAEELLDKSPWAGFAGHAELSLIHEADFYNGMAWGLKSHVEAPGDNFTNIYVVSGFSWVQLYDEARRISQSLSFRVDLAEGRTERAIEATQRKLLLDPANDAVILAAADTLYAAGRIRDALPLYERLIEYLPEGRPINSSSDSMIRLAFARRLINDDVGAETAAEIARKDNRALTKVGVKNQFIFRADALIAAYDGDADTAIDSLRKALDAGLRNARFLDDPIFEKLWDDPRFVAMQQEIDEQLVNAREQVLQLVCFNNPAPSGWQPLPATCEGVDEKATL